MSRKHQEKQQARARARRAEERARERNRRRIVIAVVVVALAAAGALAWWLLVGQDDTPEVAASETPSAAPSASPPASPAATASPDASAAPADPTASPTAGESAAPADGDETEATEAAPCPAPTDAPTADTSLQFDAPPPPDVAETVTVEIQTTCGTIVAELDGAAAPQTVSNFVFLAEQDFYVGTPFHRVMPDFVIQGGDPTGTGSGGPGYAFDDELELAQEVTADNDGLYPRGTLAMANSGPDTNGSQFFVVQADPGYPFPPDYAVFGMVVEGMEVVDDIASGPTTGPAGDQAVAPAVIVDVVVRPATAP